MLASDHGALSRPSVDNRLGYAGYVWDKWLQVYHVRHRVYEPYHARWHQPDPIGFAGGRNWFEYCGGRPSDGVDPWGLVPGQQFVNIVYDNADPNASRGGGWKWWQGWGTTLGYALGGGPDGAAAAVWKAADEGLSDGLVMTVDNLTFGMIGSLHDEANRIREENAGDWTYTVADAAGVVARETIITIASMGLGNLASSGVRWAYYANRGLSAYQMVDGAYHVAHGGYRVSQGDDGGWVEMIGGGLQIAGGRSGWKAGNRNTPGCGGGAGGRSPTTRIGGSGCFEACTPVHVNDGIVPIKEIRPGQRVAVDAPISKGQAAATQARPRERHSGTSSWESAGGDDDDPDGAGPEHDPAKWRLVTLTAATPDGTGVCTIRWLRPAEWVNEIGAGPGAMVKITIPEMGVESVAAVSTVEPCPQIAQGDGPLVLCTFETTNRPLWNVHLEGETEPIQCTSGHPFYSVDREAFVPAAELRAGERLQTAAGISVVSEVVETAARGTVYNFEVEGVHEYRVGTAGVRVHNAGPCELHSGPGSYTVTFKSGMQYVGKGPLSRGRQSANRWARKQGDKWIRIEWRSAADDFDAFNQEAQRIRDLGGIGAPNLYNIKNSPGRIGP